MTKEAKQSSNSSGVQRAPTEFEVDRSGTLTMADFWEPKTRADFYEDVAEAWSESPADLVDGMRLCQPLAWAVHSIYSDLRDDLENNLQDAYGDSDTMERRVAALTARLAAMPSEPEDGVDAWLLSLTQAEFEHLVVPEIEDWFSETPDWGFEDDYLDQGMTAQGAALQFFQSMDRTQRRLLGVKVVEGEHPGSSYYAAELTVDIDVANKAAIEASIPVRFRRTAG